MPWSNDALSDERDDSCLLMPAGIFFVVIGGWLPFRDGRTVAWYNKLVSSCCHRNKALLHNN